MTSPPRLPKRMYFSHIPDLRRWSLSSPGREWRARWIQFICLNKIEKTLIAAVQRLAHQPRRHDKSVQLRVETAFQNRPDLVAAKRRRTACACWATKSKADVFDLPPRKRCSLSTDNGVDRFGCEGCVDDLKTQVCGLLIEFGCHL
jgi:hypothetical protein